MEALNTTTEHIFVQKSGGFSEDKVLGKIKTTSSKSHKKAATNLPTKTKPVEKINGIKTETPSKEKRKVFFLKTLGTKVKEIEAAEFERRKK
ncbi:hypothetical protein BB560_005635 [Smittium megazygosporum]|uniref:Uncharacterized protein n=1 Tax=Smittium megazygosporum TaxID=133381 RepID=A0A2T9Z214_9FUNG|nr:hypothetical protein BB560_005635 [Smittium megazygosporum]